MCNYIKYTTILFFCISHVLYSQDKLLNFEYLTVKDGLAQNNVQSIAKDKYGFMWFGTWNGLCRFDGYKFRVYRYDPDDTASISNNRISIIYKDRDETLWISTFDSIICRYNYETDNFTRYQKSKLPTEVIKATERRNNHSGRFAKGDNVVWNIKKNVLWQTNLLTKEEFEYSSSINNINSLNDDVVNCVYKDNCDILWVGTFKGGINKSDTRAIQFSNKSNIVNYGGSLINTSTRAIWVDNDRIYLGTTNDGLTIINRKTTNRKTLNTLGLGLGGIVDKNVRSLCKDYKEDIWIGYRRGLDKYQVSNDKIIHYTGWRKDEKVNISGIFSICEDKSNTLWIGAYNGINRYDRHTNSFVFYDLSKYFNSSSAMSIIADSKNNLWVGSERGGLICIKRIGNDLQFDKIVKYNLLIGNKFLIKEGRVYSLLEDESGNIWVGTADGLFVVNPINGKTTRYSIKNGLADQYIAKVLSDFNGNIWISHKRGISRLNVKTELIKNYSVKEGYKGYEFIDGSGFRDSVSGELFFGGVEGYVSFFPKQIKDNPYPPEVVFTELQVLNKAININDDVNGHIILHKPILLTKKIRLTYLDKSFSVEFVGLHYSSPENNKYAYKLEGFDKSWIYTDASKRNVSYSNLPSGKYYLKVKASNSDGLWNNTPAVLEIIITPPWWLTWWAIALYSIVGGIIVLFIYKYIASRVEFRKNEEIHQAKLKFFTEVSHEFRTPLTLIIDPAEKLLSENLEKETVKHYHSLIHRNAQQLLLLINQLLDFRKLEAGHFSLNLQPSDVVATVRSVVASFETHAKERNIRYTLKTTISQLNVPIDVAKFNMALNNLLSNAFKFTSDEGEITISLETFASGNEGIIIKVHDTGVGIPKDEHEKVFEIFYQSSHAPSQRQGSGIGLALTKEIVQLHGGKLTVESEVGKGSCFSVFLPVTGVNNNSESVALRQNLHIHNQTQAEKTIQPNSSSPELPLMLIIDDNADIRNYIKLNFSKFYSIELATNGSEGFQLATETIPDIVISDIMMPGISGLELCRMLKSDERTSHIPVVLLTARQSDESKTEGYETGADAYVTKPFNTAVLRAQTHNLLEQRQRLRELFSNGSDLELKKISINNTDEAFLKKVILLVEENVSDENFDIDTLAQKLKMSRSVFYKKVKALTNQTLHDFVTTIRMDHSLKYLLSGEYSISEIAYKVGFSQPANFTRTFVKHYGTAPKKYIELLKNRQPNLY